LQAVASSLRRWGELRTLTTSLPSHEMKSAALVSLSRSFLRGEERRKAHCQFLLSLMGSTTGQSA